MRYGCLSQNHLGEIVDLHMAHSMNEVKSFRYHLSTIGSTDFLWSNKVTLLSSQSSLRWPDYDQIFSSRLPSLAYKAVRCMFSVSTDFGVCLRIELWIVPPATDKKRV